MSPCIQIFLITVSVCLVAAIIIWLIAYYPLNYTKDKAFCFLALTFLVFGIFGAIFLAGITCSSKYEYKSMVYWDNKTTVHLIEYFDEKKAGNEDRALYILNYDAFKAYRKYDEYYARLFNHKHSEKYSEVFCVIKKDNGYTYGITDKYK